MNLHIKRHTHTTITASASDIGDFELTHQPDEGLEPLIEVVGDRAVIAYLVRDDDGRNPIEEGCANGEIVTKNMGRDSTIWDDESRLRSELCCGDGRWSGENPDIDRQFINAEGKKTTLRELAADAVLEEVAGNFEDMREYVEHLEFEPDEGSTWELTFRELEAEVRKDLLDDNGHKFEEVEWKAFDLYEDLWERLAGPFVIPIDYMSQSYTIIRTSTWGGTPEHLPDGVWVADDDAIENILAPFVKGYLLKAHSERETKTGTAHDGKPYSYEVEVPFFNLVIDGAIVRGNIRGTRAANAEFMEHVGWQRFDEIKAAAVMYAEPVLKEVAAWASGEVYGCVVETFQNVGTVEAPTWEQVSEDSCWGYIGGEYAEESLKSEYFEPTVKQMKEAFGA